MDHNDGIQMHETNELLFLTTSKDAVTDQAKRERHVMYVLHTFMALMRRSRSSIKPKKKHEVITATFFVPVVLA